MKRKKTITATSKSTLLKITIELQTAPEFGRGNTDDRLLDVTDKTLLAIAALYRPSRAKVSP